MMKCGDTGASSTSVSVAKICEEYPNDYWMELDAKSGRAYSVLAVLQMVDGRHTEAIESARKAVVLRPNDAPMSTTGSLLPVSPIFSGAPCLTRAW